MRRIGYICNRNSRGIYNVYRKLSELTWWAKLIKRQLFVQPGASAAIRKVRRRMILAVKYPFGGQQSLYADRAACVYPCRRDAHLGTKAKAEAVSETRARVVEHTGAVHAAQEVLSGGICMEWKTKRNEKRKTEMREKLETRKCNMQTCWIRIISQMIYICCGRRHARVRAMIYLNKSRRLTRVPLTPWPLDSLIPSQCWWRNACKLHWTWLMSATANGNGNGIGIYN